MEKKVRLYEIAQGGARNIEVVDKKIALVVFGIDPQAKRVIFTVNPNITEYQETPKKQSLGYEATNDTRRGNLTPSDPPFCINVEGTKYAIALDSVGTTEAPLRQGYCDFLIRRDD